MVLETNDFVNERFSKSDDKNNGTGIGPKGQAALAYVDAGYSVVPLCWPNERGECGCPKHHTILRDIGKAPLLDAGYQAEPPLTRAQVIAWWLRYPLANIGILLKPAGFFVIDSDNEEADREVEERGVPPGPRVKSPRGLHRYFRNDSEIYGLITHKGASGKIDILSLGYMVVPPSRTAAGVYTWEVELQEVELEAPPAWAVTLLTEARDKPPPIILKEKIVPVELTSLSLAAWLVEVITTGQTSHPDKYLSRSEAVFAASTGMLNANIPLEQIVSILMDPRYAISSKPREQGERWLLGDIARAQAKQQAERQKEDIRMDQEEPHGYQNGETYHPPESDTFEDDARETEEEQPQPQAKPKESTPRRIPVSTDMTAVVDEAQAAIIALAGGPHLYQRLRRLSCIARGVKAPEWPMRAPDAPTIVQIEPPALRELANRAATWVKYDARSKKDKSVLPPEWAIKTLYTRIGWDFPLLEGIVCSPTLRADGAIIDRPGYDEDTGLYLDTNGVRFPPIDPDATIDNAVESLVKLDEIFADFPFAAPHFQSAALAAVLTLAARHAIAGNTPLFAVRSNTPASGKGLLVDAISMISTGRIAPHWPQVLDEEEERKRLLTIALSGDACCHIDNVTQPLGSAPLDSAITAREISDRLLGKNKRATVPFSAVLFASGNGMVFAGDTARRVLPIDLDPKVEKPEERDDFQHAPLLLWVQKNRPDFLVAALTILKAYFNAGMPSQGVSALGSFEEWSTLIRQALIWAGKPDPCEGRANIQAESDTGYEALAGLLHCWSVCYPTDAVTVSHAIQDIAVRAVTDPSLISPPNDWNHLFEALSKFDSRFDGKRLDSKRIGDGFRKIQGRVLDGKRFIADGITTGANRWRVTIMDPMGT